MARLKRPLNLSIDPEIHDRIDAYIARQEVPPSKTAIVEAALRAWLDDREGKTEKRRK
jgi:hypothetical protein